MQEEQLSFNFSARYFKLGTINEATRKVWFVLHGYGQLAGYFLRKFKALEASGICVIAPEGLSRFYLEEVSKRIQSGNNRVGATWMTKENRLMDIQNYLTFLNEVYRKEIGNRTDIEVTILGFSQGAATASRWVLDNRITFQRLILWAGIFPEDMDFEKGHEILRTKRIDLVYGTQDSLLTNDRLAQLKLLANKLNITAEVTTFSGFHEIDEVTLLSLL